MAVPAAFNGRFRRFPSLKGGGPIEGLGAGRGIRPLALFPSLKGGGPIEGHEVTMAVERYWAKFPSLKGGGPIEGLNANGKS